MTKKLAVRSGRALEAASPMVDRRSKSGRRSNGRKGSERRRVEHTFDAIPDVPDFRDQVYQATLVEVPAARTLAEYRASAKYAVPILDQGSEGACTGFALATVAHYLLRCRRSEPKPKFNQVPVSPNMLYAMARRYDEWPGEDYSGSSARGAMKAWHKHGVCAADEWKKGSGPITMKQALDARDRPLGAYYRVNHRDLVSMHAALAEVGILYATSSVHAGWNQVGASGRIPFEAGSIGGHAFAIVAYDQEGFWIQNSWGDNWGKDGFGHLKYDDWLMNGSDVWVARLGVPLILSSMAGTVATQSPGAALSKSYGFSELHSHIISIGNNGELRRTGAYGTDEAEVRTIVDQIVRATAKWKVKRILLYAHGGLVSEEHAVQKVAELRASLLGEQIYPVSLIWKTDYLTTIKNLLGDAARSRRPEGALDTAKEFMLDRADDLLEPVARALTGRAAWEEMKENALLATRSTKGGIRFFLDELTKRGVEFEFHLVGHSAGSIVHAGVAPYLVNTLGANVGSCTLWAPACTMALFEKAYAPLVRKSKLGTFSIFALTDQVEQDDDCARIYNKSLLYLVAHAFELTPRIPLIQRHGTPLLGMEKFLRDNDVVVGLKAQRKLRIVPSPNEKPLGSLEASRSRTHGGFDDDEATLRATLASILGQTSAQVPAQSDKATERARNTRFVQAWME